VANTNLGFSLLFILALISLLPKKQKQGKILVFVLSFYQPSSLIPHLR